MNTLYRYAMVIALAMFFCNGPTGYRAQADEWGNVVAAAKREGRVVVVGPQARQAQVPLEAEFRKRYPDIAIEYQGVSASRAAPKFLAEQRAGQFLNDVMVHGTSTFLGGLKGTGALEPILPYLAGPSSGEAAKWRGGKFNFADEEERFNLVMSTYVKSPWVYNSKLASEKDFRSTKDLLDPKWKGKIGILNPRQPGGGSAMVTYWYAVDGLGKEFIERLLKEQGVLVLRDDRQLLDWVAKGRLAIGIGPGDAQTTDLIEKGLPLKRVLAESLAEPPYVTAGTGSVIVFRKPPHPNAVKVYLNYLLSRDGQLAWSKAVGFASLRTDVPNQHVPEYFIPKKGVAYLELHKEKFVRMKLEVSQFLAGAVR